ncbi:MAG: hypothetical protein IJY05_03210 [Clostridia bacterium]|nr:hypothetical protein [Clostridia bacterium]
MSDKVTKKKYWTLKILQIVFAVLPLIILVLIRKEKYIYSVSSAIRFSLGGVLALIVIVCTLLNVLHVKGLGWAVICLALSYLLENLIADIQWIFLCLTVGLFISKILGLYAVEEKEKFIINKSAETTAKQMEKVVKKYHGSGRV